MHDDAFAAWLIGWSRLGRATAYWPDHGWDARLVLFAYSSSSNRFDNWFDKTVVYNRLYDDDDILFQ